MPLTHSSPLSVAAGGPRSAKIKVLQTLGSFHHCPGTPFCEVLFKAQAPGTASFIYNQPTDNVSLQAMADRLSDHDFII